MCLFALLLSGGRHTNLKCLRNSARTVQAEVQYTAQDRTACMPSSWSTRGCGPPLVKLLHLRWACLLAGPDRAYYSHRFDGSGIGTARVFAESGPFIRIQMIDKSTVKIPFLQLGWRALHSENWHIYCCHLLLLYLQRAISHNPSQTSLVR
jgi:hypothetical protein